ncbi:MAG: DHH family phosphoesterase [Thermodesulfovibrionales bacterium]
MKVPEKLISFLKSEKKYFIATHIDPEADALGSSIALSMALEMLNKETFLYERDPIPEFYHYLPGQERFKNSLETLASISELPLILLDCNTPDRAGLEGLKFKSSAVIDHHEAEGVFGDIKWIVPEAAATGIMVFYLIKELGIKITREMAINLYSAIAIDTGTFRFGNTTSEVLRIGAELAEAGASPVYISNKLYETWSKERFALFSMTLNTLEIKDSVAITYVTQDMYKKTGTGPEDTENFPSFPRIIKDIKVSVFLRELEDNSWKVSLRSKGDFNVAHIASQMGGGGHKNAAGFVIKSDLVSAKDTLLKLLQI